jgi:hypothetical protein
MDKTKHCFKPNEFDRNKKPKTQRKQQKPNVTHKNKNSIVNTSRYQRPNATNKNQKPITQVKTKDPMQATKTWCDTKTQDPMQQKKTNAKT